MTRFQLTNKKTATTIKKDAISFLIELAEFLKD